MKLLACLLLVLSLSACKKDPAPTTPPDNTGGGSGSASTDRAACTSDDECTAVELECCDACNGGEAVGVNKAHEAEVVADSARGRGECTQTMCTEMGCAPWVSTCNAGKCEIARGSL